MVKNSGVYCFFNKGEIAAKQAKQISWFSNMMMLEIENRDYIVVKYGWW